MDRTCKKCGETKPLTEFQRHDSGRRWTCRDCRRLYLNRWEMGLTGAKRRRHERNRKRSVRNYLDKMIVKRRAERRERHDMLRAIITTLYREGMTQKELAAAAGVTESTLRRIRSEEPMERGITSLVEEKILAYYARRRGVRP